MTLYEQPPGDRGKEELPFKLQAAPESACPMNTYHATMFYCMTSSYLFIHQFPQEAYKCSTNSC